MRDALSAFGEVTLARPSIHSFERVKITRLNAHYQPSLRLARLAVEGAGVQDSAGTETAPAFFVPMWRVWESAVASALRDAGITQLHEQPEFADRFIFLSGRPSLRVTIRPDLLVGIRSRPVLAIDLKWRPALVRRHGKSRLQNDHLYQLAAYCVALGCDGFLLYPRMDDEVESSYEFSGRRIHIRTVDLSVAGLGDLRRVAEQIADLAASSAIPGRNIQRHSTR
jgi:5-methylcytosine-specific restriction enzyme subunit McrC